eukprot:gnl/MRDRNA2_/MRDRNA2_192666_c0_seq1.p1 gnl/MRDRNA2_/MRDRNA2_192666_c0~~gnl/MRDRNA2_/MRDRNA2_192666_c0_seq1.p1  ORF type:complete len:947 (-),score=177.04 gnl/MRDRNA2_/MRDRNA2_192666_c0_seq1:87-2558(-)
MAGQESSILIFNAFSEWSKPLQDLKKARKAAATLLGNQGGMLLQTTLHAWLRWAEASRHHRVAGTEKFTALFMSEGKMLCMRMFGEWKHFLEFARKENQKAAHAQQIFAMLMGGQNSLMRTSYFQAWYQEVQKEKKERFRAQERAQARERSIQVLKRSIQKMAGQESSIMVYNVFVEWARPLAEARKARKAAMTLLCGNDNMLQSTVFASWARYASNAKKQALHNQVQQHMALMLFGGNSRLVSSSVFHAWRTRTRDAKGIQKSHAAMNIIFAMTGKGADLRKFLMLWIQYRMAIKQERLEVDRMLVSAKKEKSEMRYKYDLVKSMSMVVRGRLTVLMQCQFNAWADRVARLLQLRQKYRWLITIFGDQSDRFICSECFECWAYSLKTCKRVPLYLKQVAGALMRTRKSFTLAGSFHAWLQPVQRRHLKETSKSLSLAALLMNEDSLLIVRSVAAWKNKCMEIRHERFIQFHNDELQRRMLESDSIMAILTTGHTKEKELVKTRQRNFLDQALTSFAERDDVTLQRLILVMWRGYMLNGVDAEYRRVLLHKCRGSLQRTLRVLYSRTVMAAAVSWFLTWVLHCRQSRRSRALARGLSERRFAAYRLLSQLAHMHDAGKAAQVISEWFRVTKEAVGRTLRQYEEKLLCGPESVLAMQVTTTQALLRGQQAVLRMHDFRKQLWLSKVISSWRAEAVSHCRFYETKLRIHQALRLQRASWTTLLVGVLARAAFLALPFCFELWRQFWQTAVLGARRACRQQELAALCQQVGGIRARTRGQDNAMLQFLDAEHREVLKQVERKKAVQDSGGDGAAGPQGLPDFGKGV